MNTQMHRAAQVHRPKPKRKLPVKLILGGMTLLVLGFIAVVVAIIVYAMRNDPSGKDLPLVLIHSPLNREQVSEGDGVLVHATARSQAGLQRVELWVDDMLIAQRDAGGDEAPTSMVLSADWVPTIAGNHHLIVRAISARDADGQATVDVETIESDAPETAGAHTVQEGETLDTIAESYGTTPEDLTVLNPGLDPAAAPAPGAEIIIPDSEPPSEGSQLIPTDSEPPPTVAEPPAAFTLLYYVGFSAADEEPGEPITLRMELIGLRTPLAYENLNCYVGIAGQTPLRYPDADGDQSTDESFAVLAGSPPGGTSWNIGDYLHGDHVPSFPWPENQDLPFDMSCVGISGGGTQANRLGRVELAIPPEDWDGFVHQADVVGPEGAYGFSYRVSRVDDEPGGVAKEPDPNMTSPTNLGIINYDAAFRSHPEEDSEGGASSFPVTPYDRVALLWDYNPRSDEEVATVFRIYLNGARFGHGYTDTSSGRPRYFFGPVGPEIQHPACGEQYVWTVTAWRPGGDNDGFESLPSEPLIFETPDDRNCGQTVSINFLSLETFDLGGDGRYDDRWGDVGPVYGHVYANEQSAYFTGGPLELPPFTGRIGQPWGLSHYTVYDLEGGDADEPFANDDPLRFIAVRIPWFEALDFGLVIMDDDDGRCRDSDDRGCDDLVCEVTIHMVPARDIHNYDRYENSVTSEDGRCRLTYNYQLGAESPLDRPEW